MRFKLLTAEVLEKKMLSWASAGLLIFVSAFLWSPSRDGLQGVYAIAFFLPMLIILPLRKFNFNEYGGWPTIVALSYSGFAALSTLWGAPKDFGFFVLQWGVLAAWLCGSCLVFTKHDIDVEKYLSWFVVGGVLVTISTFSYYFMFIDAYFPMRVRMVGWNVFRNANEIGTFCGIIALIAFTLALQSNSLKRTWLFYLLALMAGAGMIATFSRGALFALVVMASIALLIVRPALKVWLPPVLAAALAFLILFITTQINIDYTYGRGDGIIGNRSLIWKEILDRSQENILLGIGMSRDTAINIPAAGIFNHAHNAWLDTLYRTGLIGLILVLLHLATVLQKTSCFTRLLPLYLWLGYGCIFNLFDGRCFFWEIGAKWFLYWIPAGLIVAIHTGNLLRQHSQEAKIKPQVPGLLS